MCIVQPVMLQKNAMNRGWNTVDRDTHRNGIRCAVDIVVVPHQHRSFALCLGGERVDIGRLAHARGDHVVQRNLSRAGRADSVAGHQREHAEDVQHRLVDAVRCQRAEAFKGVLILKLERPAQHREEVHAVTILKVKQTLVGRSRVCRI